MPARVLFLAVAGGVSLLLLALGGASVQPWSPPSASAAGHCAVSPAVGAYQPPNGPITAAFNAAGYNGLFPGHEYFGLQAMETGPRNNRTVRQPYVPPTLLKAIGWVEASWRQADNGGAPIISFDCGYGIMQITAPGVFPLEGIGMIQASTDPNIYNGAQVPIATSYTHNIAFGAKTLIGKWNAAPEWRPVVGNGDPALIEDWYYAVWSYNGFVSSNYPGNFSPLRGDYSCNLSDGFNHNRSQFPYQELVMGCVKHPPAVSGVELWPPIPVAMPATLPPFAGFGEGMDIPTPQPAHTDPTASTLPSPVTIDIPGPGVAAQPFVLAGWAVDYATPSGTGIDAVHAYAYPSDASGVPTGAPVFLGAAALGGSRPDVATIFGNPDFVSSGYGLTVRGLRQGFYDIVVYARSTLTGTWFEAHRVLDVPRGDAMALDVPAPGSPAVVPQPLTVAGWAIDPQATSGTGVDAVHVYAYPSDASGSPTGAEPLFLGVAAYGGSRPDVGAVYGGQFTDSGYGLSASGLDRRYYRLVVYARSTVSGLWNEAHRVIQVPPPAMALDAPSATTAQPFMVAGWAIDRAAASGTGVDAVHAYVYPSDASGASLGAPLFLGAAALGFSRPDVGALYGSQFTNSGYGLWASGLAPGFYRLVVYARSTVTGAWQDSQRVFRIQ